MSKTQTRRLPTVKAEEYPPFIKMLRKESARQGFRAVDLAEACGVTRNYISLLLTARQEAAPGMLARLTGLLGITEQQCREVGRDDVADLVAWSPSVKQASTADLLEELRHRVED